MPESGPAEWNDEVIGRLIVEKLEHKDVWHLTDPVTGKEYYAKLADIPEIEMTRRASELELPEGNIMRIPRVVTTDPSLVPPEIRDALKAGGQQGLFVEEGVPEGASLSQLGFSDDSNAVRAFQEKPLTKEEYRQIIDSVRQMNEAGVANHDLLTNSRIVRDEDGKVRLTLYAYDFDPANWPRKYHDPAGASRDMEDYCHMVDHIQHMIKQGTLEPAAAELLNEHKVLPIKKANDLSTIREAAEKAGQIRETPSLASVTGLDEKKWNEVEARIQRTASNMDRHFNPSFGDVALKRLNDMEQHQLKELRSEYARQATPEQRDAFNRMFDERLGKVYHDPQFKERAEHGRGIAKPQQDTQQQQPQARPDVGEDARTLQDRQRAEQRARQQAAAQPKPTQPTEQQQQQGKAGGPEGHVAISVNGYTGGKNWEYGSYTRVRKEDGSYAYHNEKETLVARHPASKEAQRERPVLSINVTGDSFNFSIHSDSQPFLGKGNFELPQNLQRFYGNTLSWNDIPKAITDLTLKHTQPDSPQRRQLHPNEGGNAVVSLDGAANRRYVGVAMGLNAQMNTLQGEEMLKNALTMAREMNIPEKDIHLIQHQARGANGKPLYDQNKQPVMITTGVEIALPPEAIHPLRAMTKDYITPGGFFAGKEDHASKHAIPEQKMNGGQVLSFLGSFMDPKSAPAKFQQHPLDNVEETTRRIQTHQSAPDNVPDVEKKPKPKAQAGTQPDTEEPPLPRRNAPQQKTPADPDSYILPDEQQVAARAVPKQATPADPRPYQRPTQQAPAKAAASQNAKSPIQVDDDGLVVLGQPDAAKKPTPPARPPAPPSASVPFEPGMLLLAEDEPPAPVAKNPQVTPKKPIPPLPARPSAQPVASSPSISEPPSLNAAEKIEANKPIGKSPPPPPPPVPKQPAQTVVEDNPQHKGVKRDMMRAVLGDTQGNATTQELSDRFNKLLDAADSALRKQEPKAESAALANLMKASPARKAILVESYLAHQDGKEFDARHFAEDVKRKSAQTHLPVFQYKVEQFAKEHPAEAAAKTGMVLQKVQQQQARPDASDDARALQDRQRSEARAHQQAMGAQASATQPTEQQQQQGMADWFKRSPGQATTGPEPTGTQKHHEDKLLKQEAGKVGYHIRHSNDTWVYFDARGGKSDPLTGWKIHISVTTPEAQAKLAELGLKHGIVVSKFAVDPESINRHREQCGKTAVFYHSEKGVDGKPINWPKFIEEANKIVKEHGAGPPVQRDQKVPGSHGIFYRNEHGADGEDYVARHGMTQYGQLRNIRESQLYNLAGDDNPFERVELDGDGNIRPPDQVIPHKVQPRARQQPSEFAVGEFIDPKPYQNKAATNPEPDYSPKPVEIPRYQSERKFRTVDELRQQFNDALDKQQAIRWSREEEIRLSVSDAKEIMKRATPDDDGVLRLSPQQYEQIRRFSWRAGVGENIQQNEDGTYELSAEETRNLQMLADSIHDPDFHFERAYAQALKQMPQNARINFHIDPETFDYLEQMRQRHPEQFAMMPVAKTHEATRLLMEKIEGVHPDNKEKIAAILASEELQPHTKMNPPNAQADAEKQGYQGEVDARNVVRGDKNGHRGAKHHGEMPNDQDLPGRDAVATQPVRRRPAVKKPAEPEVPAVATEEPARAASTPDVPKLPDSNMSKIMGILDEIGTKARNMANTSDNVAGKAGGQYMNAAAVGSSIAMIKEGLREEKYDKVAAGMVDLAANGVDMGDDLARLMQQMSPKMAERVMAQVSTMSPEMLKRAAPAFSAASKTLSRVAPLIGIAIETYMQEGNFIEADGSLGAKGERAVGATLGTVAAVGVASAAATVTSVAAAPLAAAVLVGYSASEFTSASIKLNELDRQFIVEDKTEILEKKRHLHGAIGKYKEQMFALAEERGIEMKLDKNGRPDMNDPEARAIIRDVLAKNRDEQAKIAEDNASTWYKPKWLRAGYTNGEGLTRESDAIRERETANSALKELDQVDTLFAAQQTAQRAVQAKLGVFDKNFDGQYSRAELDLNRDGRLDEQDVTKIREALKDDVLASQFIDNLKKQEFGGIQFDGSAVDIAAPGSVAAKKTEKNTGRA